MEPDADAGEAELLVDGRAFAYWVWRNLCDAAPAGAWLSLLDLVSGFEEALQPLIAQWPRVTVVMDGWEAGKAACQQRRLASRARARDKATSLLSSGRPESVRSIFGACLPSGAWMALHGRLQDLSLRRPGVAFVLASGEADPCIAHRCLRLAAAGVRGAVLSPDTDFAVFPAVARVFDLATLAAAPPLTACTWSGQRLRARLRLGQAQTALAACLAGTDVFDAAGRGLHERIWEREEHLARLAQAPDVPGGGGGDVVSPTAWLVEVDTALADAATRAPVAGPASKRRRAGGSAAAGEGRTLRRALGALRRGGPALPAVIAAVRAGTREPPSSLPPREASACVVAQACAWLVFGGRAAPFGGALLRFSTAAQLSTAQRRAAPSSTQRKRWSAARAEAALREARALLAAVEGYLDPATCGEGAAPPSPAASHWPVIPWHAALEASAAAQCVAAPDLPPPPPTAFAGAVPLGLLASVAAGAWVCDVDATVGRDSGPAQAVRRGLRAEAEALREYCQGREPTPPQPRSVALCAGGAGPAQVGPALAASLCPSGAAGRPLAALLGGVARGSMPEGAARDTREAREAVALCDLGWQIAVWARAVRRAASGAECAGGPLGISASHAELACLARRGCGSGAGP